MKDFTDFVSSLPADGEIEPESFVRVWQALRRALRSEVRRRGLWDHPPSFLGVIGGKSWRESDSRLENAGEVALIDVRDALDELAVNCYVYVFVDRLGSLRAQLKVTGNIEGLVFRSIRNFLHDSQKKHDRLGYDVYVTLKGALEMARRRGRLHILSGGPKIANSTVFGFGPSGEAQEAQAVELEAVARSWTQDLLPDLVTARGGERKSVMSQLERLIYQLPDGGIEAFRFQPLIDALKREIRTRWAALWQEGQGETAFVDSDEDLAHVVHLIRPDTGYEEREHFLALATCMEEALEKVEGREKTRQYLAKLWRFLHTFAQSEEESPDMPEPGDAESKLAALERLPAYRELERHLGIPRKRLPGLFATLRHELEECLSATSGSSGVSMLWRAPSMSGEGEMTVQDRGNLQAELLAQTAQALRQDATVETRLAAKEGEPPRPGDVYVFPATAEHAIEWVILAQEEDGSAFLLVPVDAVSLVGSADVAIPASPARGPLTVRCRYDVTLGVQAFDSGHRSRVLVPEDLARAQARRHEIEGGEHRGSEKEQEVDLDPEYWEWQEILATAQAALVQGGQEPQSTAPGSPGLAPQKVSAGPWRRWGQPLALAASLLLALGLGVALSYQLGKTGELEVEFGQQIEALEEVLDRQAKQHEEEQSELARDAAEAAQRYEMELAELRTDLAQATRLEAEVPPWELLSWGRERNDPKLVSIPAGKPRVLLIPSLPPTQADDQLVLWAQATGNVIQLPDEVQESDRERNFPILLPSQWLPDGNYELQLLRGPDRRVVVRYEFRIERE